MDYATLIAEHDHIDALCEEVLALTGGPVAAPRAMALLHQLAQAVDTHLATEDRLIYDRMWKGSDVEAAQKARCFVQNFEALVADWGVYLTEWTEASIAVDWSLFCEISRSIITRVQDRVRAENGLLYPAAFRAGHMTLRPVSGSAPVPLSAPANGLSART